MQPRRSITLGWIDFLGVSSENAGECHKALENRLDGWVPCRTFMLHLAASGTQCDHVQDVAKMACLSSISGLRTIGHLSRSERDKELTIPF